MDPIIVNPDELILKQMEGQWQKIAMMLVWKLGKGQVISLTHRDMQDFQKAFLPNEPYFFVHGLSDSIQFSVITKDRADAVAQYDRRQKGKPS